MKHLKKFILTLLFVNLLFEGNSQCFTPFIMDATGALPVISESLHDIASAPNGDVFMVVGGTSSVSKVFRFTGSDWSYAGGDPFGLVAYKYSIVVNKFGVPYVAAQILGDVVVSRFDGTNWNSLPGFSSSGIEFLGNLTTDTLGNIYLSGTNQIGASYYVNVVKYDGISSSVLGTPDFAQSYSGVSGCDIDLSFSKNNYAYIAYPNYLSGGKLCVKKFNTSTSLWDNFGPIDFSSGQATNSKIVLDTLETPFVTFNDQFYFQAVRVMKYNGVSWVSVGPVTLSGGMSSGYKDILISKQNEPVIAFRDYDLEDEIRIQKFNGTSWVLMGISDSTMRGNNYNVAMTMDTSGSLYTSYGTSSNIEIAKLRNGYWEQFQDKNLNNSFSLNTHYILDKINNIHYLALQEKKLRYRVTVLRYKESTNTLDTLGRIGFSPLPVDPLDVVSTKVKLQLDTNNVLYLAFGDYSANGISVMKYTSSGWAYVGAPGLNFPVSCTVEDFVIDKKTNIPYVSYKSNSSGKANVKYYNGTSWVFLGSGSFSAGDAHNIRMVVDTNSVVHVLFRDMNVAGKASCMKFNGSAWVYEGIQGFTSVGIYVHDFLVEQSTNKLYGLLTQFSGATSSVMTFNAGSWTNYGSPDFTEYGYDMEFLGNILFVGSVSENKMYSNTGGGPFWADFSDLKPGFFQMQINLGGIIYTAEQNPLLSMQKLNWVVPPIITTHPSDFVCTDSSGLLSIEMYEIVPLPGNPYDFQWQMDSGSGFVNLNDDTTYTGTDEDTLMISSINSSTSGNIYQCIVSNVCGADTSDLLYVNISSPNAAFSVSDSLVCLNAGSLVDLTPVNSGGIFSGLGVSGTDFDPAIAGPGLHSIQYIITDSIGCVDSSSFALTVVDLLITANFSGLDTSYCVTAIGNTLVPDYAGGTFIGNGITGTYFSPFIAGSGTHSISYSITDTNGCADTSTLSVTVLGLLINANFTGLDTFYCLTESGNTLIPVYTGGTFTGSGISGNFFNPAVAGAGTYGITYTIADTNGCVDTSQQTVVVDLCLGIENEEISILEIYPNPFNDFIELNSSQQIGEIVIYDNLGKVVFRQTCNTNSVRLSVSGLENGIYYFLCRDQFYKLLKG